MAQQLTSSRCDVMMYLRPLLLFVLGCLWPLLVFLTPWLISSVNTRTHTLKPFISNSQGSFNVCFSCSELSVTQTRRHTKQHTHTAFFFLQKWKVGCANWNCRFQGFSNSRGFCVQKVGWVSSCASFSVSSSLSSFFLTSYMKTARFSYRFRCWWL